MGTVETTTLAGPKEAKRFLLAKGTHAPVLHPLINSDNPRIRWNGWNETMAVGVDAAGLPVKLGLWHFAAGHVDCDGGLLTEGSRLGKAEFAWKNVTWPVEALPALSVINHPEHTPGSAT